MQLRILLSCALLAILLPGGAPAWGQSKPRPIVTLDRIAAVVNDEVITQQELTARVDFAFRQLRQQGTPPPTREVIERQLIERLDEGLPLGHTVGSAPGTSKDSAKMEAGSR